MFPDEENAEDGKRLRAPGTLPGVFWQEGEFVLARLDLFRIMELLFDDESAAADALLNFHNSLLSDDQTSSALRDEYSIEGMLDFIDRFANRENVLGLRWPTRIRIATDGLQFEMPDGRWDEIHVESVSNTYNWSKVPVDNDAKSTELDQVAASAYPLSPLAYTLRSHFGLSHDANWEGVGRVFREDGLSLWFPDN